MNSKNTCTYGYTSVEYNRFRSFAWKMLLSFGITYMFFYNGRQNINLVMTQMAEGLGSTTAAMGVVSSALFWCYAFGQLINGRLGAFFWLQALYDVWRCRFCRYKCFNFIPAFYPRDRYSVGSQRILSVYGMV